MHCKDFISSKCTFSVTWTHDTYPFNAERGLDISTPDNSSPDISTPDNSTLDISTPDISTLHTKYTVIFMITI